MALEGDEIESAPVDQISGQALIHPHQRDIMGRTGPKNEPPREPDGKSKKPPAPIEEDEPEDGDIATPKRDRSGTDDEPL
jgi:hypothetical protein